MALSLWIMRIVEVLFFAGLVGCAFVVIISWISIFAEGFKGDQPRGHSFE